MLGQSVASRGEQLTALLNSYFSAASTAFTPLGAAELVELYRHVKSFSLDLPVQECLTAGHEGYVVLARLKDYCTFVRDDRSQLRRYLFDSNVRAFLGDNLVNADIAETLGGPAVPNFWRLNNGVTILATSASLVGKILKLKDIQIVDGLQTTESIHRHYVDNPSTPDDARTLLIKVIVSQDASVRDQVIRATNNQSAVEPAALHATDRVQRNIEEILIRFDWYYERRTNHFRNEGRPESRILTPLILAVGSVALLLKNPARSSKLKQKHLRNTEAYDAIYSEDYPIDAWPVVATLIRAAEMAIVRFYRGKRGAQRQVLSAWRGCLAYIAAARLQRTFGYHLRDLAALQVARVTDDFMDESLSQVAALGGGLGSSKVGEEKIFGICAALEVRWGIAGRPTDGKRELPIAGSVSPERMRHPDTEEFIRSVSDALPPQPWKPGVHLGVAQRLGVKPARVTRAIQALIASGVWLQQRDGVVCDASGNEVSRDDSRAPRN
jgi:AIPR protein